MQDKSEIISSVLDGETDDIQPSALDAMLQDSETRSVWTRYQLIGEALRETQLTGDGQTTTVGIAERVRIEIENEPPILAPRRLAKPKRRPSRFLQPAAGLAIAASVAAVAVIGIQGFNPDPAPGDNNQISVSSLDAAERVFNRIADTEPRDITAESLATATQAQSSAEQTPELNIDLIEHQRRLNSYLVNFNEQRSSLSVPGVNPYVRMVGFESE